MSASSWPETRAAWGRLKNAFRRMMAQRLLGWALWWDGEEVIETMERAGFRATSESLERARTEIRAAIERGAAS